MKCVDWTLVDELAAQLGVKPNARRMWRTRGQVPYRKRFEIIALAKEKKNLSLTNEDFERLQRSEA